MLASGLSNTDTIIQYAGPVTQTSNIGLTISVSNISYATQNVGGVLYWLGNAGSNTPSATWIVTVNLTQGPNMPPPNSSVNPVRAMNINATTSAGNNFTVPRKWSPPSGSAPVQGSSNINTTYMPNVGSGVYQVEYRMNGPQLAQYVYFSVDTLVYEQASYGYGCWVTSPSTANSGNLFP